MRDLPRVAKKSIKIAGERTTNLCVQGLTRFVGRTLPEIRYVDRGGDDRDACTLIKVFGTVMKTSRSVSLSRLDEWRLRLADIVLMQDDDVVTERARLHRRGDHLGAAILSEDAEIEHRTGSFRSMGVRL